MNTKIQKVTIFSFILSILLIACGPAVPVNLEPFTTPISYKMPNIVALKGYPELQTKLGITISAIPASFAKATKFRYECEWIRSSIGVAINAMETGQDPNKQLTYKVTKTPYYEVTPKELIFKIKINNNLARVLRLAGTIVAFQVEGKMVNLSSANYKEFIEGFIIPRQEAEYSIIGPAISTLPGKCNFALLLYDIVSEVDAAGNPTKKANFEWYFTYEFQTKEEDGTTTSEIRSMTPREAQELRSQR